MPNFPGPFHPYVLSTHLYMTGPDSRLSVMMFEKMETCSNSDCSFVSNPWEDTGHGRGFPQNARPSCVYHQVTLGVARQFLRSKYSPGPQDAQLGFQNPSENT